MATPLRMPDMGTVEGDVTLVRWLKAEGETVSVGEPLFEVETDKGISEVEAALGGVLLKKLVSEGSKAGAGETIALIRRPGEPAEKGEDAAPAKAVQPDAVSAPSKAVASSGAAAHGAPSGGASSPVLRALARKRGVDIAAVKGTGPGGKVTRDDILRATPGAAAAAAPPRGGAVRVNVSAAQAAVARTVTQSWREKPVFHVHAVVDMGRAAAHRAQAKAAGRPVSWDALLVKAAAGALAGEPLFRRFYRGDDCYEHPAADVAVAIGVDDELFVAAVRGPAARSTAEISAEIEALARRAQARSLGPQDADGSCFLVSNLGMFPIESFDAIIHPEHCAALAAGPAAAPAGAATAAGAAAPVARLTLTVDHRIINGRTAARFLSRVKQILETGAFA